METHLNGAVATDVRVRFVVYLEGKIVFIHRITSKYPDGYYVLPGGGVDPGETPEQAVVREAREELDMEVVPIQLLFAATHKDSNGKHTQLFYLCDRVSGELSTGLGIENTPEWQAEHGTHTPVLLTTDDIAEVTINPYVASDYIKKYADNFAHAPFISLIDV